MNSIRQPQAHVLYGAHKNGGIVPRRNKTPALPVALRIGVDSPDDDGTTADDIGAGDTALQRILDQSASDTLPGIAAINGELPDQKARDRIRWSSGPDRARCAVRLDDARRQPVVADNSAIVMNDQDAGKPTCLVGPRKAGEPRIERRLAAIEYVEPVRVVQKFDCRKRHLMFPRRGPAQPFGRLRRGSRGGCGDGLHERIVSVGRDADDRLVQDRRLRLMQCRAAHELGA